MSKFHNTVTCVMKLWRNDINRKYMSMFLLKNVCYGLIDNEHSNVCTDLLD